MFWSTGELSQITHDIYTRRVYLIKGASGASAMSFASEADSREIVDQMELPKKVIRRSLTASQLGRNERSRELTGSHLQNDATFISLRTPRPSGAFFWITFIKRNELRMRAERTMRISVRCCSHDKNATSSSAPLPHTHMQSPSKNQRYFPSNQSSQSLNDNYQLQLLVFDLERR